MRPADSQHPAPERQRTIANDQRDGDRPDAAARLESWLRRSPPFTLSLSLHVAALLVLAMFITREPQASRHLIDLAFGPEPGAGPPLAGIAIAPDPPAAPPQQEEESPDPQAVPESPADTPMPAERPTPAVEPSTEEQPPQQVAAADARPAVPSVRLALVGRSAGRRDALLEAAGGGSETESAVGKALEWIVKNQEKSGLWSLRGPYLDGSNQENRLAATAMALLALQGAGNTTREGIHQAAVRRAWKALMARQLPEGAFDCGAMPEPHAMYGQAQATIAVCELLGMTEDDAVRPAAERALAYAVAAQMPDGGWRYRPPQPNSDNKGDMSVTGWFMMALKTGEMAGLGVPSEVYERLERFLDAVFISDDKGYGYQILPQQRFFQVRPAITAEALLCRQYLGWQRENPRLQAGVDLLFRELPLDFEYPHKNVYAWYYATQVCHHMGGPVWRRWNDRMRVMLTGNQVARGKETGSWDPAHDQWGHFGGRLFMTCLCACMLEAYYRHMPLHADR